MRLLRIDDAQENQWVEANAFVGVPAGANMSMYWRWIGATDLAVADEWRWTDGALFWLGGSNGAAQNGFYANWVQNSPKSSTTTNCAVIQHNAGGFWSDHDCTLLQAYVCEQY
jgi:hypothetical protein